MPIQRFAGSSHPYHNYHHRRFEPKGRRKWPWVLALLLLLAGTGWGLYLYNRPLPGVKPQVLSVAPETKQVNLNWSSTGQAAIGSVEQGVLASHMDNRLHPIASTAKLITALTVLEKKPLKKGEQGPMITMTSSDIDIYNRYYQQDGSLVQIAAGEQLSQRQMLEGMLLPSANNFADSLAVWAYGSLADYRVAAQAKVKKLNMDATVIGSDASGFSPDTQSTAEDLVRLGIAAMRQPVIVEVLAQEQTTLPLAGVKPTTNWLLHVDGVISGKTGNTVEAGGVFVFAAQYDVDKAHSTTIVGAIQGEQSIYKAISQARSLLAEAKTNFRVETPIEGSQIIGTYRSAWGAKAEAVAVNSLSEAAWVGRDLSPEIRLNDLTSGAPAGSVVGLIRLGSQTSPVVLKKDLAGPSWAWRLGVDKLLPS